MGFVFLSKGTYTPVYVWDEPICMHACLPAYLLVWTEPDRIGPLLISYLASNQLTCSVVDNDGHTAVPMCPALPQRPSAHPWPLLRGTDPPLSVRCSQDQQPRQCPFHHSGPQCSFHKLSQALGLKERTAMGFGLCKHTDACGWQVGAQTTMFTPIPIPTPTPLFAPSVPKPMSRVHPPAQVGGEESQHQYKEPKCRRHSGKARDSCPQPTQLCSLLM